MKPMTLDCRFWPKIRHNGYMYATAENTNKINTLNYVYR